MSNATNFTSVPILDYSLLSDPSTRDDFISQLRHALVNVGFLYLKNSPVAPEDIDALVSYTPKLFDLPPDEKERIRMVHSPHFFGYSRLGAELTKGQTDQREQFDFGTPFAARALQPGDPAYRRLWGPSQWPREELLPGFRATYVRYLAQVEALSFALIALAAEAFGLPRDAFAPYFGGLTAPDERRLQHRSKIVKYPARADGAASDQGVGAHFDGGFLTFLLQASDHPGLQVQNLAGEWIDAPPIPGTFVVNIGKALEMATQGLARATSHRVLSPVPGSTPRYSIPFFTFIAEDVRVDEIMLDFKPEVLKLKDARGQLGATDSVNYAEYGLYPSGQVNLIGRVKSHPDVGERHYPELFQELFPQGLPAQGSAY